MRSWPARKTQFALFASVVRWIIFAALLCILLPASTKAQENIWVGQPNVPGFWSDLAEWNLGTVPASSIPDGSINIDISQGTVLGDVSFTNSRTLTIEEAGQYNILSLTTVINAHDTALIDISNSGRLVNSGSLTNELSASLENNGFGELVNNGVISNELSARFDNSPHSTLINNGVISNQFLGIMENAGFLDNMSGGLITNDLSSTIDNSAIWKNESGATLSNFGAMKNVGLLQNLGLLNNAGSFANINLLQIGSGGVLNNSGSISNVLAGGFVVQSGGTFNNSGSFLSDYLSSFESQANSTILNTGTMSLGGNTILIGGALVNNGSITMVAGPPSGGDIPIQPPAPPLLITATGKLSGTGTVDQGLFGVGVINQGVMAPGDPLGTFTIQGNYQQTSTGMLEILLGGIGAGDFSQLDITGSADLSGTLDVELFAGFDPQAGEMFEILKSGAITNLDFLSMLFPTLPDGLFFKLDREGNNLFLDVTGGSGGGTSVPEPGTLLLLAAGLASVLALRRKKNVWAVAAKVTTLAVTFMCLMGPAAAQNTWMSGGHPVPLWSNAGAWSLNVVPDGSTDISIPNGTVGGDVTFTNRNTLTIGAPATLTILSPTTITNSGFSGFIVNGGSLVNNGTLVNASSAALNNGATLTNNGTLLNEIGAQLNNSGTLDNFGTFDNRVAGFVVNTGNLNNQNGGLLINDLSSTIENDHSIANEAGATLSNSGTINGSGIFVNLGTVDNSGQLSSVVFNLGGTINNTGGSIRLGGGSDIVGGSLGGPGGNVILSGPGATATLDGSNSIGFGALTIRGTYTSDVGTTTNLLGTINNQGNIQVNSGTQDTNLALIGTTTLQGGGTVTLANNGGGRLSIVGEIGGPQTLINVDNTIQGTGVIDPIFVNQAAGTVNANVSGQTLDLLDGKLTNAGLLEATGGGVLFIKSTDVVNAGGTIAAVNGGIVSLVGGSVQGGLLNNVSGTLGTLAIGSVIELDGNTPAGAVTIRGTYTVDVGSTTILLGTINNQGNIQVNSGGLATHLALMGDTTLQGGGTVTLANNGGGGFSNISENGNTQLTLINVDNTIQGTGAVDPILVNQTAGTVNANVSGQLLELLNGKLTNAGLLEATSGGELFIKSTDVVNAGGTIAAVVGIVDVEGGTLTNSGTVQVNAGSMLLVNAPFTQTGGKTQIDGSMTLTQGENISGGVMLGTGTINGNITMTGGAMHPGGANTSGTLIINGDLAESNALFDIFIGASGNGLLVVNGAVTLGDATDLSIDLLDGFKPFDGEMFTIMDFLSGSGIFANAPSTGFEMDGFDWTILYGPNSIVLDAVAPVEGGGGGTSVPEPGTGALLLGAIAAMCCVSLLRKRQPAPRA